MTNVRFLHTADIHLDSPLRGLAGHDGRAAERIRTATRQALAAVVELAIVEQVDGVVIAGDLYDGDWPDFNTGLFFVEQMGRLLRADVPVYLLYGNHDAASRITKSLNLPDNVHVFGSRAPQTFQLPGRNVALHGQSFPQRDVTDNLASHYPPPIAGMFNIGVLHTGLGGMGGHANYAPCRVEQLANHGYDYWALGHVHKRQVVQNRPPIVFPGNVQGRHVRETGAKGVYLVTVTDGEVTNLDFRPCDAVRWCERTVSVEQAGSMADVANAMGRALTAAVTAEADGRLLVCRLRLQGRCHLHGLLLGGEEQLLAEARAAALQLGDDVVWVEKVVPATTPPESLAEQALRQDAVGALQQMLQTAVDDDDLKYTIEQELADFIQSLPHDLRREVSANGDQSVLESAANGNHAALMATVIPQICARLASEASDP